MRFNKTVHDFGEIRWNVPVDAIFRFINISSNDLIIENITKSCGCAVISLSAYHLRPNERGVLTVRFFPTGFVGQITQMVQIWIKGYKSPITLYLKANVNPLLHPIPDKINFGRIPSYQPAEIVLILKNTSGRLVRITRLETLKDYIKAYVLKDGDEPTIRVKLDNPPIGKLYDHLYIYTNLSERPLIDIPVQADIICKWDLSDNEFFFGFINVGTQMSRKVRIKGLSMASIKEVWSNTPVATVNFSPIAEGVELTVHLDLTKARVETFKEISGDVFIQTKDQEQPLVRLPIIGVIQNPNNIGGCCQKKHEGKN